MVIQEKDQVQLKIVKQQYRGSVKRASDMKMKVELYRVSIHMFVLPKKYVHTEYRCVHLSRRVRGLCEE